MDLPGSPGTRHASRWLLALAVAMVAVVGAGCGDEETGSASTAGSERASLTVLLNPAVLANLPVEVAAERGCYEAAGVEVTIETFTGPEPQQLPRVLRGEVDVMTATSSPSLFNSERQGFAPRILAAINEEKPGYAPSARLVVRKDVAATKALEEPADLRGRKIDSGSEGSGMDYLVTQVLAAGKLSESDVTLTHRGRTPPDLQALLKNKVTEVQAAVEPLATGMVQQGLGETWLGIGDVSPGWQGAFAVTSAETADAKRDALVRFLAGLLCGTEAMAKVSAPDKWDPGLLDIAAKWSKLPPPVIKAMGAGPFAPTNGRVNAESLASTQDLWSAKGLIREPVAIENLIDTELLGEAARSVPQP